MLHTDIYDALKNEFHVGQYIEELNLELVYFHLCLLLLLHLLS